MTVSPFGAEQGTSLETPSRARASSCQAVGTTWFFSSCGGILEASFNFMAAITVCSDFGTQENKAFHCFHCFPIYLP